MNDTDPAVQLPEDQCVLAENVEFFFSALGERRNGCSSMSLSGSGLDAEDAIVHISQRFPTNDPNVGELWAIGATEGVSTSIAFRSDEEEWTPVIPVDDIDPTAPFVYQIVAQPYQNKMFFAYLSDKDRLHVWDGEALRATGITQPAATPTGANHGSGTYTGIRYFRVRFIEKDADDRILRRSEPSESLAFTPSGSGDGITVTRPATVDEFETHWELEASADDATYYRIQTIPILTTTALDTTASVLTYATLGPLSEEIGQYLLQPSAKYLLVDGDRLIGASHWTDGLQQSRVWWTPVSNDPGVGNDERLPLASLVDNYQDLDNYEGGGVTGLSQTVNGSFYVFKWSHVYMATRTGIAESAYDIICLSKVRGALPGSIVSGMDEYGHGCIYFLDPLTGPSRLGAQGLQAINGMRKTWTRVNRLATGIVAHGVYYPEKRQTHWWVAADSENYPSLKLVLQVTETREDPSANVIRGWSIATGLISEAYCSAIVNVEILDANGVVATIARRPYIGLPAPYLLQQCDLLSTDSGQTYIARIVTKAYLLAGLLNKWGTMTCALLADATTVGHVQVNCLRDFGKEETYSVADLAPTGEETMVLKKFDNLVMSDAYSIQFEFSDPD